MKQSQCKMIEKWLYEGNKITSLEALHKFGCLNLKGRIWDLRQKVEFEIDTQMVKRGLKTVAEYSANIETIACVWEEHSQHYSRKQYNIDGGETMPSQLTVEIKLTPSLDTIPEWIIDELDNEYSSGADEVFYEIA